LIELIVLDVDGTMTDGQVVYSSQGEELKSFNIKDGMAIKAWNTYLKKQSAIITGRDSKIVKRRSDELSVQHLHQGKSEKGKVLQNIMNHMNIDKTNVAIIGDDLNDLSMLEFSSISFCPADASSEMKKRCDVVLKNNGGSGAVREMIEIILKDEDRYDDFVSYWQKY